MSNEIYKDPVVGFKDIILERLERRIDGQFFPYLYMKINSVWGISFNNEDTDPLETLSLETELNTGFNMKYEYV